MATEPPPRIVGKFEQIWRDWLYYLYEFIESHTGGSTPTPPATGLSWNAHGNTAVGSATQTLIIEPGTLFVKGVVGDTPSDLDTHGVGTSTGMVFIPSKGALRAGTVTSGSFYWDASFIGQDSVAIGNAVFADKASGVALGGPEAWAQGISSFAAGKSAQANANYAIAIGDTASANGINSTAIGKSASASGLSGSIAVGTECVVNANGGAALGIKCSATGTLNPAAVGTVCTAGGSQSAAIGFSATTGGQYGVAVGSNVEAQGTRGVTIGSGYGTGVGTLINPSADTLWMGCGSNVPTIIMVSAGTTVPSNTGIVQQAPLSTLDIGGSVGFAYSLLTGSDAGSDTLSDEYVVKVNMQNVTAGNTYTINLPALGPTTIDRRIYYIKIISLNGTWGGGTAFLAIQPAVNDGVEDIASGGSPGTLLADNTPVNIGMSNANRGTSLTFIADNTSGGWWLI